MKARRFKVYYSTYNQGFRYEIFDTELRYEVMRDLCLTDANEQADRMNRENEEQRLSGSNAPPVCAAGAQPEAG